MERGAASRRSTTRRNRWAIGRACGARSRRLGLGAGSAGAPQQAGGRRRENRQVRRRRGAPRRGRQLRGCSKKLPGANNDLRSGPGFRRAARALRRFVSRRQIATRMISEVMAYSFNESWSKKSSENYGSETASRRRAGRPGGFFRRRRARHGRRRRMRSIRRHGRSKFADLDPQRSCAGSEPTGGRRGCNSGRGDASRQAKPHDRSWLRAKTPARVCRGARESAGRNRKRRATRLAPELGVRTVPSTRERLKQGGRRRRDVGLNCCPFSAVSQNRSGPAESGEEVVRFISDDIVNRTQPTTCITRILLNN